MIEHNLHCEYVCLLLKSLLCRSCKQYNRKLAAKEIDSMKFLFTTKNLLWAIVENTGSGLQSYMSRIMRKPVSGFPTAGCTIKMARGLKFGIYEVEGLYFLCSKNKSADQLRGDRSADLRLCFHVCRKQVFSWCGLYPNVQVSSYFLKWSMLVWIQPSRKSWEKVLYRQG